MSQPISIAVIPDAHIPNHHQAAFDVIHQYMRTKRWEHMVWLGDAINLPQLSRHDEREGAKNDLLEDVKATGAVYKTTLEACSARGEDCKPYFVAGNHEARYQRALPEVSKWGRMVPQDMFRVMFRELGREVKIANSYPVSGPAEVLRFEKTAKGRLACKIRKSGEQARAYGLTCMHGVYSGANPAQAHATKMALLGPVVFGHTHRIQSWSGPGWGRDKPNAHSFGWLGAREFAYAKGPGAHELGFGEVLFDGNAMTVKPHRIMCDDKGAAFLTVSGKVFRAG